VRKVVDTVGDLDNVLYEISNESEPSSIEWQHHFIDLIHRYEASKPMRHPVGMTSLYYETYQPRFARALAEGPADWISPGAGVTASGEDLLTDPAPADGKKVIVVDTDHLCGLCANPTMVWKSFTRGNHFLYMDVYDRSFLTGPRDLESIRAIGYMLDAANRANLAALVPRPDLASTGYCLAQPGVEYLVYAPLGETLSVDLGPAPGRSFAVEWLDTASGTRAAGAAVPGGGRASLTSPFAGPVLVHLRAS
jgi:hypothetical protein